MRDILKDAAQIGEIKLNTTIITKTSDLKEASLVKQCRFNQQEIRETLSTLCDLNAGLVELRVFLRDGTIQSGFYKDLDKLAADAAQLDESETAAAICITLNPVKQELLFHSANRLSIAGRGETTSDEDIISRRFLLIDLDPVREARTNSTNEEHATALDKALAIREWLTQQGWPMPAFGSSGNGMHLLYRIDLANDDAAKELVRGILKVIAEQFDDKTVKVDTSVSNAARVVRLYGTTNRKGEHTGERPQRIAQLYWDETPTKLEVVTASQLQELVSAADKKTAKNQNLRLSTKKKTWAELNPDLVQIFLTRGKKNDRGIYEMRGLCHDGQGDTALCYDPTTGLGWCNKGCDTATIRRAFDLPKIPNDKRQDTSGNKLIKKDELVRLAADVELFCEPDGKGEKTYATVPVNGHYETYRINSSEFRLWLTNRFYSLYEEAVSSQPMQDAINALTAKAYCEGARHKVFNRIGELNGKLYYDLGDELWRVVEIEASGWRILDKSPVKFIRPSSYKAQVIPVRGGSLDELRCFINIVSDVDWVLFIGWLISCFRATGPYAILTLAGTQDAAKSTTTKMLRALIDPSHTPVRALPKEERDLMVGAKNNWLLAFDNLSHISEWLSDALCRVSTGGGQANRENYTNGDEYLFDVMRPVVMNGIEELATRPDLTDRTINVFLPSLSDDQRRVEDELYADYNKSLPRILGAIFDVLSVALKNLPDTKRDRWPRMADVAKFVTAAEDGLGWPRDKFLTTYEDYRRTAKINTLEASNVGTAILKLMEHNSRWEGTATDLLGTLEGHLPPTARRATFPASARSMSGALRRLIPNLKEVGIEVDMPEGARRGTDGKVARTITLTNTAWRRPTTDDLLSQNCRF
jgi:hypothetical protein